jgi:Domain of unknown function (DUF4252)
MKTLWISTAALGAVLALTTAGRADSGAFDFGELKPPGAGGEYVEVNIKGNLLAIVAKLAEKEQPDAADFLKSIHSIKVNVIGLDDANREVNERKIVELRNQLEGKGWEKNVTVKDHNSDVAVYTKLRGQEAVEGVVVTVIDDHKEAVLVNVVGDVRPEKLAALGERFDIEPLRKLKDLGLKEGDKKSEKKAGDGDAK